jgi:hypothetical protein
MSENPTKFEEVDADVLRKQAVEDWAVDVKPTDSLKKVVKALDEAGVDWDTYAERYGYDLPDTGESLDGPDTIENVSQAAVAARTPEPQRATQPFIENARRTPPKNIAYAAAPAVEPDVQYLVKMERPNVSYQVRGYRFTKEHPFALVSGSDLEYVLRHEPGFRQAYPSEAQEFYS